MRSALGLHKGRKTRKAEKLLDETKPDLLVGSPMCTKFSSWQRISRRRAKDPCRVKKEWIEAVTHLEFVCHRYRKQAAAGRWFLHEHPAQADSWGEPCMPDATKIKGADVVVMDQCQSGQCDE